MASGIPKTRQRFALPDSLDDRQAMRQAFDKGNAQRVALGKPAYSKDEFQARVEREEGQEPDLLAEAGAGLKTIRQQVREVAMNPVGSAIEMGHKGVESIREGAAAEGIHPLVYAGGFPQRAAKEGAEMIVGAGPLIAGGIHAANLPGRMAWGDKKAYNEAERVVRAGSKVLPEVARSIGGNIVEEVTNPIGSFFKRPLTTSLDALTGVEAPSAIAGAVAKAAARLNATGRFAGPADRAAHAARQASAAAQKGEVEAKSTEMLDLERRLAENQAKIDALGPKLAGDFNPTPARPAGQGPMPGGPGAPITGGKRLASSKVRPRGADAPVPPPPPSPRVPQGDTGSRKWKRDEEWRAEMAEKRQVEQDARAMAARELAAGVPQELVNARYETAVGGPFGALAPIRARELAAIEAKNPGHPRGADLPAHPHESVKMPRRQAPPMPRNNADFDLERAQASPGGVMRVEGPQAPDAPPLGELAPATSLEDAIRAAQQEGRALAPGRAAAADRKREIATRQAERQKAPQLSREEFEAQQVAKKARASKAVGGPSPPPLTESMEALRSAPPSPALAPRPVIAARLKDGRIISHPEAKKRARAKKAKDEPLPEPDPGIENPRARLADIRRKLIALAEQATKKSGSKTRWKAMRKTGADNVSLEARLRTEGVDPGDVPMNEWRQALGVGHPNRVLPDEALGAGPDDLLFPKDPRDRGEGLPRELNAGMGFALPPRPPGPAVPNEGLRKFAMGAQRFSDATSLPTIRQKAIDAASRKSLTIAGALREHREVQGTRRIYSDESKFTADLNREATSSLREQFKGIKKPAQERLTRRMMGLDGPDTPIDVDPQMWLAEQEYRNRMGGYEKVLGVTGDLEKEQARLRRFQPLRLEAQRAASEPGARIFDEPGTARSMTDELEKAGHNPAHVPMFPDFRGRMKGRLQSLFPILMAGDEPGILKHSTGQRYITGRYRKPLSEIQATYQSIAHQYLQRHRILERIKKEPSTIRVTDPASVDYSKYGLIAPDMFTRRAQQHLAEGQFVLNRIMESPDPIMALDEALEATMHMKPPADGAAIGELYAVPKLVMNEMIGQMGGLPPYLRGPAEIFFDTPNKFLRWTALTLRPGFYVNNLIGGGVFSGLSGTTAKGFAQQAERGFDDLPISVRGSGYASVDSPPMTTGGSAWQRVKELPGQLNEGPDDFFRGASFRSEVEREASKQALRTSGELMDRAMTTVQQMEMIGPAGVERAVKHVNDFFNDYASQSPFQKNILRRALPFQSFLVHVSKMVARLPVTYPARTALAGRLAELGLEYQNEQWRESGLDPEDVKPYRRRSNLPVGTTSKGLIETRGVGGANPFSGFQLSDKADAENLDLTQFEDIVRASLGPVPSYMANGAHGVNGIGMPLRKPGFPYKFGGEGAKPSLIDFIRMNAQQLGLAERLAQPKETYDLVGSPWPWEKNYLPTRIDRPRRYGFDEQLSGYLGFPSRDFELEEVQK